MSENNEKQASFRLELEKESKVIHFNVDPELSVKEGLLEALSAVIQVGLSEGVFDGTEVTIEQLALKLQYKK